MPTFYWVGSTASSVNSLSWNQASNWRTISVATGGATLARWVVASRPPFGSDSAIIGSIYWDADRYTPIALPVYSPLLFGGLTTGSGSTAGTWSGTTAGTSIQQRKGPCYITVSPTYPFSQVGGSLNTTILNEWATQTRRLGITAEDFGVTGSTADGEETAVYFSSSWGMTSSPFSLSKPSQFIGENSIRVMGGVYDHAKSPTRCYFRGYTSGATSGMSGGTYGYDGSFNSYFISTDSFLSKTGTRQNKTVLNGAITAVETPIGSFYSHGDSVISGVWNRISSNSSTRGGSIFCTGVTANAVILAPNNCYLYREGSSILPFFTQNGFSGSVAVSSTDYDTISFDQSSNAKGIVIGSSNAGIVNFVNTINIEGDLTSSSGFSCVYQDNTGGTGATAAVMIQTSGNLILYPTILGQFGSEIPSTCTVGYPFSEANFRNNNVTNIDYIYNMNGYGYEFNIGVKGNLNTNEAFMNGGSFFVHPQISKNNTVAVGQLSLFGNSVLDLSQSPDHKGLAANVIFKSTESRLLPKAGTVVNMSTEELDQDVGDIFG